MAENARKGNQAAVALEQMTHSLALEGVEEAVPKAQEGFHGAPAEGGQEAGAAVLFPSAEGSSVTREEHLQLERRVKELEASIRTALDTVFPRVERLLQQLEERSPPAPPTSPSSAPPSAAGPSIPSNSEPPSAPSIRSLPSVSTSTSFAHEVSQGRILLEAAERGQLALVQALLDDGANVNFSNVTGWTPLHSAVGYERADVVRLLVERGADVNAVTRRDNAPLHFAAQHDTTGHCVEALIAGGADVNRQDSEGSAPLHWAAQFGTEAALSALVAGGAHVNCQNNDGSTPLHCAARFGREQLMRLLIAAGAKKTIKDKLGRTPHQAAHESFRKILLP